jgi:hypothetical protein
LADFLPHGLPVLQSIHPLPPLRPNHFLNPSLAMLLLLLGLIPPILSAYLPAFYQRTRCVCTGPFTIPALYFAVTSILLTA